MKAMICLVACLTILIACGGSERDPEEHLLQHHQQLIERAEEVEAQLLEAAEKQRREIDEQ